MSHSPDFTWQSDVTGHRFLNVVRLNHLSNIMFYFLLSTESSAPSVTVKTQFTVV